MVLTDFSLVLLPRMSVPPLSPTHPSGGRWADFWWGRCHQRVVVSWWVPSSGDINCMGRLTALRADAERAGGITSCLCAYAVSGTSAVTLWSFNFHAGFFWEKWIWYISLVLSHLEVNSIFFFNIRIWYHSSSSIKSEKILIHSLNEYFLPDL